MMSDDAFLIDGKLQDLCLDGRVACPRYDGMPSAKFWGFCWCTPRAVYERMGGCLDEGYSDGLYYEDDDYYMSIRAHGFDTCEVQTVLFGHPYPSATLRGDPRQQEKFVINGNYYNKKWNGVKPDYHGGDSSQVGSGANQDSFFATPSTLARLSATEAR